MANKLWALIVGLSMCGPGYTQLLLAKNAKSDYQVVIPAEPTAAESRAAAVFRDYFKKLTGVALPLRNENAVKPARAIYIGRTAASESIVKTPFRGEGFVIASDDQNLYLVGGTGRSAVYAVYSLLENYFGCLKLSEGPAIVPAQPELPFPQKVYDQQRPAFQFRQAYYPASADDEYLEWHKLHRFEDLWGLWGHSFFKLVPPAQYFKSNPDYFALVNGKREASQLCLSHEAVFRITVDYFKKAIAKNPDALYWSIGPNDELGYCTCDNCARADAEEGGPQGSLIRFVNKVAARFPEQTFTTLAYGYTARPPKKTKPARNVYIILSTIDAYRHQPLEQGHSAAAFRNQLRGWQALTPNLFTWDYTTQFTNYLAPFPDYHTLKPNMQFFQQQGIRGVFAQGSGDTYGDMAEMKSYLQAKLLWNPALDADSLQQMFLRRFYGKAAPHVKEYLTLLTNGARARNTPLDIYGNPVNNYKDYLSPEQIDVLSGILDKAEEAVQGDTLRSRYIAKLRLPLEYTVLQQSRFFGPEKYGFLQEDRHGNFVPRPNWLPRVQRFVAQAKKAGVTEVSEGGDSPDAYLADWKALLATPFRTGLAWNKPAVLQFPFSEDYPSKRERTLTDGVRGGKDFSYNWLLFYGTDMVATVDLGKKQSITLIEAGFLHDPRHWIFEPLQIVFEVSADGEHFVPLQTIQNAAPEEDYAIRMAAVTCTAPAGTQARYVRVRAACAPSLPAWRFRENKKPSIACDEIYVK